MEFTKGKKHLDNIQEIKSSANVLIFFLWSAVLIIVSFTFILSEPLLIPCALFFIITLLLVQDTSKHLNYAAKGIKSDKKTTGEIKISVEKWSDSTNYFAEVMENNDIWKFEFIPFDSVPINGLYQATLIWIEDVDWPVLIETESEILYPRYKPKKIKASY